MKTNASLPRRLRAFRNLSRRFTHKERPQYLMTELLLFGVLVAIGAWPMLSLIDTMATSLK